MAAVHVKAGLEAELADARKQISARDVAISQQMQQIGRLEKADHDLAAMTSNYQRLDAEFVKLSQNLSTQTAFALDLSARHEITSEALLQAQGELAILRNERPLLQSRNLSLEAKVTELEKVLQGLRLDKARLEQRILMTTQHQQNP